MNLSRMPQNIIQVSELVYEYSGFRALDGVSFNIPAGSITALVGPNGAGKTTLMKCLTALLEPVSGSIFIDGLDVRANPRQIRRLIGFLPDFFGLYDGLSVEQCLTYACLAHEVPISEVSDRVTRTLQQLNLTNKRKANVTELSRGMKQRLAIGQSIIHKPKLLILDEPASGLDPEARSSLATLFKELNKEGMTLLVSSHILAELDEYANHLLSLRNGHIAQNQSSLAGINRRLVFRFKAISDLNRKTLSSLLGGKSAYEKDGLTYLDFSGTEDDQAELLRSLVSSDLPVLEFYVERDGLQRQYLNQIK